MGDNSLKELLIPHVAKEWHHFLSKALCAFGWAAAYQVVGGVMAYQADDG